MNFVRKLMVLLSAVFLIIGLSSCEELLGKMLGEELYDASYPDVSVKDNEYDYSIHYGETLTLEVEASVDDDGTLSYQWYSNDKDKKDNATAITGATKSTYTYTAPSEEIAAKYFWCKVTNKKGTKKAESWTYTITVSISNIIRLNGKTYESAEEWDSTYTYYLEGWVYAKSSLVIPAGTVIKTGTNGYLYTDNAGTITAVGTEENPIIFTSYRDNSVGITIPEFKGNSVKAAKGDWDGIEIKGTTGSKFEYCNFSYSNVFALNLNNSADVKNCTFTYNKSEGRSGALHLNDRAGGSIVTNNTFYNNDWPLSCPNKYTVATSNIFHNPDNEEIKNQKQAIVLDQGERIEDTTYWAITELPYFVTNGCVEVSGTLNIADNVIVKFAHESELGTSATGTISPGTTTIFTSYRDDAHGGDIEADGQPTAPADGDWQGIYLYGSDKWGWDNELNKDTTRVLYNDTSKYTEN